MRWQYLRDALPRHGWEVAEVSARPNPTANAVSTDPRAARLAAARAKVMTAVGAATRPAYRRLGIQPEAFPPNALWSLTGRPAVRRARERVAARRRVGDVPAAVGAVRGARRARRGRRPFVAEMRDLWAGNPYFDAGGTLLTRIEKRAFARAGAIVTVTESCASSMRGLHPEIAPRLEVLPNGFDPVLLELRDRPRDAGERATLVHAGTLYGDRSAVTLLRALARPELASRTRLVLVGAVDPLTTAELRRGHARCEVVVEPPMPWRAAVERVRGGRHRGRHQQPRYRGRHGRAEQALRGARARHAGAGADEPAERVRAAAASVSAMPPAARRPATRTRSRGRWPVCSTLRRRRSTQRRSRRSAVRRWRAGGGAAGSPGERDLNQNALASAPGRQVGARRAIASGRSRHSANMAASTSSPGLPTRNACSRYCSAQ